MIVPPNIQYVKSRDGNIAYQVLGSGPYDLVYCAGFMTNLDIGLEFPQAARCLEHLSSFSRVILFDRRGFGLSDPITIDALPTWETWADDLKAVLDVVGSERAAILAERDAGMMGMLFAATEPERTSALILANTYARRTVSDDYPCGDPPEKVAAFIKMIEQGWGTEQLASIVVPSMKKDAIFLRQVAKYMRAAATPREAVAYFRYLFTSDARSVLSSIRVPTLVLHRSDYPFVNIRHGHYLAEHIPNAKFIELPGSDGSIFFENSDDAMGHIEEFLTGSRESVEANHVLATVLFTDIVDSTKQAAELGDRKWHDLLDRHHAAVRKELQHFRGCEVNTTGDGFLATFEGAARAIRCALAIREAVRLIGIEIRAGLHTGECELVGEEVRGIAVHIGARIVAKAEPGEVLVSGTVKELVMGSGISFGDRGVHTLKGVPGEWRLFAVEQ
jgi:class 3 adenylate cyclase/pimeloyl-ACP methyl ester carboxylesterase